MELWNFSDITFLIFFISVVVCVLIASAVIISFSIDYNKSLRVAKKLEDGGVSTRVYKIDVKKNVVYFFNKNNLRNKRTIDMNGFYARFAIHDVTKVKTWIFNICLDPKSVDPYLEVDVMMHNGKSSYFSLLKLVKYDSLQGIIHAESFILRYISNGYVNKKFKGIPTGVIKRSAMEEIILKDKSTKGFTYAIRFFYKKQLILSNDKIERYMMMTLKNIVYPFASNPKAPRQIIDDGDNEILLFDVRIDSSEGGLRLANSIAKSINKCIGVNGFENSVSFCIGVLENSLYYQDFDSMVIKAQEACMNGQHLNQQIVVHKKEANQFKEVNKYRDEVEKLLKPNALRFLFRPIINASKNKILGRFEYVKTYDTPFATYSEMAKYASRYNKNRELFTTIAKYVIPKFSSEVNDKHQRLFLKVSFLDIEYIVPILSQIPETSKIRIALIFDEHEINENASNLDSLIRSLTTLTDERYELAMLMKDKNLLLDNSLYELFDYFVVGSMMIGEMKVNNRSRLSIHSLIEQLLRYKKPIIATDLESWQSIELIIKSGISIVSSEVISPSNDMFLPLERKKLDRLLELENKYR